MPSPAARSLNDVQSPATASGTAHSSSIHKTRSLPALAQAQSYVQTTSAASTTSASAPSTSTTATHAHSREIPLLGEFPADLHWAYDYLGKVQSLADELDLGSYEHYLQSCQERCVSAHIILAGRDGIRDGSARLLLRRQYGWDLKNLQYIREAVSQADVKKQDPCVLIVEGISKIGVQALGMAFDVNPCFFARHLGHLYVRDSTSNSHVLTKMRDAFMDHIASAREMSHAHGHQEFIASRMENCTYFYGRTGPPLLSDARISCCQISGYGWLVLVDPPIMTPRTATGPFQSSEMLFLKHGEQRCSSGLPCLLSQPDAREPNRLISYSLKDHDVFDLAGVLRRVLLTGDDAKAMRNFLFDPNHGHVEYAYHTLPCLLTLCAWRENVAYIEHLMEKHRHEAIANPSLETFHPLTLLRRNIADLQRALMTARSDVEPSCEEALLNSQEAVGTNIGTFEAQYIVLEKRVKDTSIALNNEIQLVIGSVTVQDSAIMKEQSRRATLLTLLAAFYLPLTLVTGIFGMNIKEFDDVKPPSRLCFQALFAVIAVTLAFFVTYKALATVQRKVPLAVLQGIKQHDILGRIQRRSFCFKVYFWVGELEAKLDSSIERRQREEKSDEMYKMA